MFGTAAPIDVNAICVKPPMVETMAGGALLKGTRTMSSPFESLNISSTRLPGAA